MLAVSYDHNKAVFLAVVSTQSAEKIEGAINSKKNTHDFSYNRIKVHRELKVSRVILDGDIFCKNNFFSHIVYLPTVL